MNFWLRMNKQSILTGSAASLKIVDVEGILPAYPSMTPCMPQRGVAPQMARDEARHGKAIAGLLKRYFGK